MLLVPIIGAFLFVVLYIISTLRYPGGSQADKQATGFSWLHNYWCNLLNDQAINGQPNPAKPVAATALFVLCVSLTVFWFQFSKQTFISKRLSALISVCGGLSMLCGAFLYASTHHDLFTNLASGFGVLATMGVLFGLYRLKWKGLFVLGLLNFVLVALNNFLYFSNGLIHYLPLVQKITFAAFLFWVCSISLRLFYRHGNLDTRTMIAGNG